MQVLPQKCVAYLGLISFVVILAPQAIAQSPKRAIVFAPSSNIRSVPNGKVVCSVRTRATINVYNRNGNWYETDFCGDWGFIHQSQIRFQQDSQAEESSTFCDVVNIQSGQLALRFSPNGKSRAGLNNGNIVRYLKRQGIWSYVRVIRGPNRQVNGLEGWVNSDYLNCRNG